MYIGYLYFAVLEMPVFFISSFVDRQFQFQKRIPETQEIIYGT